jgi:hypothetical protein
MIWPTPYAMTTTLAVGDGTLVLNLPIVSASTLNPPSIGPPQSSEERPGGKVPNDAGLTPFDFKTDGHGHASAFASESSEIEINGRLLTNSSVRSTAPTISIRRARSSLGTAARQS